MAENQINTVEEWRPIPGASGYLASNFGRVKNRERDRLHIGNVKTNGYRQFLIKFDDGIKRQCLAHRLIALTFIGPPPEGKTMVNHIDVNKLNNRIENLEWVSAKENGRHALLNGRYHTPGQLRAHHDLSWRPKGSENAQSKLTEDQVIAIRQAQAAGTASQKQLGKQYGVSQPVISWIVRRRGWKHVP